MTSEYEDEYETRVWLVRTMAVGLAAVIAVAVAFVVGVLPPGGGGSDDADEGDVALSSDTLASADSNTDPESGADEATDNTVTSDVSTDREDPIDEGADTEDADTADAGIDEADIDDADIDTDIDTGIATAGVDDDADAASADASSPPITATTSTNASTAQPSYPTLPDGSPVPVLGIYDGDLITLSGVVPSQEAADRLRTLALAFSKVPDADVANLMTVDPTIPLNVGVRVIEMNSIRFPEGTPRITAEHAEELDRVALLMTALPQVTTVVIGHADQRGDSERNFALSADRARAALDYIVSQGIESTRLSARGAGESDLLTLNDDDAALALNRRTEFVISGLFVDPPPGGEPAPGDDGTE